MNSENDELDCNFVKNKHSFISNGMKFRLSKLTCAANNLHFNSSTYPSNVDHSEFHQDSNSDDCFSTLQEPQLSDQKQNFILSNQSAIKDAPGLAPQGFVFGEGMSTRVANSNTLQSATLNLWQAATKPDTKESNVVEKDVIDSSCIFTQLANAIKPNSEPSSKCLGDSVAMVEIEKHKNKANLDIVEKITGEENEQTILKTSCKSYIFDKDKQTWSSLGASYLHLNDPSVVSLSIKLRSRLIVRLQSTLRLIVNSPIWPEMKILEMSSKSLHISCLSDDGKLVRSFLFVFPTEETTKELNEAISKRIRLSPPFILSSPCDFNEISQLKTDKSIVCINDNSFTLKRRISDSNDVTEHISKKKADYPITSSELLNNSSCKYDSKLFKHSDDSSIKLTKPSFDDKQLSSDVEHSEFNSNGQIQCLSQDQKISNICNSHINTESKQTSNAVNIVNSSDLKISTASDLPISNDNTSLAITKYLKE